MDRRQQKTRKAIYDAFTALLAEKNYSSITVQDIIDAANVGRTTFYAHFETKDELLKSVCEELFGHVIAVAVDSADSRRDAPRSVFCHLLKHLEKNDSNILGLLSCESSELFLAYFKTSMNELIRSQFSISRTEATRDIPIEFLINHVTCSFVDMVHWWIKGHMQQTPEELDRYFRAVIEPIGISPVIK
ncbi:MAG: TetR/AcrR family transcriptional regulator [Candidatus Limivicinus sp.]|jgi:AcrR family transcriptional regulator